jgi:GNAT superfamily N-acetyltransferase
MTGSINESEELEQEAWKDSFAAVSPPGRVLLGLRTERYGRALALAAPSAGHFMLNRVIGFAEDDVLSAAELAAHYERLGVSGYMVHVSPGREARAAPELAEAGLVPFHRDWVKLVRRAGPTPALGREIAVESADRSAATVFGEIFAENFDLPPAAGELWAAVVQRPRWHCFIVKQGERAIAAGALFVDGDIGYFAGAATRPQYRGQGVQTALIAARVRVAESLGCRALYAETGVALPGKPNHSEHNLLRVGFKLLTIRRNFVPGPARRKARGSARP